MKTVTYYGGAFDPAFPKNTGLILKAGHKVKLNDAEKEEDRTEVEVADILVFDENGTPSVRRNVQHEDDKIEAKDHKGEECHHPYYEED